MQRKNIKVNALLNSVKTLMTILFPIVTTSYLSRVLGKNGYGKFNYSLSIVAYFSLIAALGINTYAIREGAKVRDNKEKETILDSEIFSLNMLSTIFSYLLLVILLVVSNKLVPYRPYILIISINIIFVTLGTDWVNSIYEDYFYITLRYILIQVIALFAMIIFVKTQDDLIKYTFVYVFSQVGANIANFFYVKKYVRIRFIFSKGIFRHLKPVLVLFASTIAINIYVNSDITILGILKGDAEVGIYSVASKIYSGAKQIAVAATVVTIPRISAYIGQANRNEYNDLLRRIFNLLFTITIPLFTGIFMLSKQALYVIGGSEFVNGYTSLRVLCCASIFSILAYFFAQCVLIPNSGERYFMFATIAAAVINIVLNFLIIPGMGPAGAALTTLLSEFITMVICMYSSRKLHDSKLTKNTIFSTLISSMAIVVICICVQHITERIWLTIFFDLVLSMIAFLLNMKIFKNEYIGEIIYPIMKKLKSYRK